MSRPITGWHRLDDGVGLYRSSTNAGVVHEGGEAVLIDPSDASIVDELEESRGLDVTAALFTHYHRDTAGGARSLARRGIDVVVPAAERECFESVAEFWADPAFRWHLTDFRPHPLLPTRPIPVDGTVEPGEDCVLGDLAFEVLPTPGHTEGGVSYGFDSARARDESDGQYVFCGDLLHGSGALWDAYSLQRHHGDRNDYHGFLGDRERYLDSLSRISDADVIVPARGDPIHRPSEVVDSVSQLIEAAYRAYVRTSALRHYGPEMFDRPFAEDTMPVRDPKPCPPEVKHVGTTWALLSADGHGLAMDCGWAEVLDRLRSWEAKGEVREVSALWLTHYHHDHVEAVPEFRESFDAPILAERHVADVLEAPEGYRLPCQVPDRIEVDRVLADGEEWDWQEWTLSAHWFPGQTRYHAALLAEGRGRRLLFAGDAFTPSGMDDYCAHNRNPIGADRGYRQCLDALEELDPTHVFNCHVEQPFEFTDDQVTFMRENLREREELFGDLLAWEHPDFGLDPHWARCVPYDQTCAPGERARMEVRITNYAGREREFAVRPELPPGWTWNSHREWSSSSVVAGGEGSVELVVGVPADVEAGMHVFPVSLQWGDRTLRRFREARVRVDPD
jgi:glyoxylase-like metal-dependent hydrolase (beta-lactamase superfamily II)